MKFSSGSGSLNRAGSVSVQKAVEVPRRRDREGREEEEGLAAVTFLGCIVKPRP